MIDTNDIQTALRDVVEFLNALQLPYHVTGGLASSYYGEPRFTQYIDIVLRIAPGQLPQSFIDALPQQFTFEASAVEDAVRRRSLFQLLHEETVLKIDFHVGEDIPGELERSQLVQMFPGLIVPLVSREDSILSKLLWIKKGSGKSRDDVRAMLLRKDAIELSYLTAKADELGVLELLNEFLADSGSAGGVAS